MLLNILLANSPGSVVIQLLQALSVTFKGVEALGMWMTFVIPDQIALKGQSITLSEQLHRVPTQKDTITKARSQRTNQLQLTDTFEKLKAGELKEREERGNNTASIAS